MLNNTEKTMEKIVALCKGRTITPTGPEVKEQAARESIVKKISGSS